MPGRRSKARRRTGGRPPSEDPGDVARGPERPDWHRDLSRTRGRDHGLQGRIVGRAAEIRRCSETFIGPRRLAGGATTEAVSGNASADRAGDGAPVMVLRCQKILLLLGCPVHDSLGDALQFG